VEHQLDSRIFIIRSASEIGLELKEVQTDQFLRYLTHLIEWNRVINLTSIIDPYEIIIKHFIDSLAALVATDFSDKSLLLDIGSGGGFPGIPIKIMRPDLQLILVEPVQKKCSFLNSVIGLLRLQDVSTFNGTIEQYAEWPLMQSVDIATIRALKYKEMWSHIPALLTHNGKIILYRTEPINNEEIGKEFHLAGEKTFVLPQGSGKRVISAIQRNTSSPAIK
jgi:16S rRNA (guanine527-N7)-methyltransferase